MNKQKIFKYYTKSSNIEKSDFQVLFDTIKKAKVVLVHGVFDLLHVGHVRHLNESKAYGKILVVSITADKFVHKGPNRPVYNEDERAEILSNINAVDFVIINNCEDCCEILSFLTPDCFVKGVDYKNMANDPNINLYSEILTAKKLGVEVRFTNSAKFSTTDTIDRIKSELI